MNEEALENLVRIHKLHHEAVDANEVDEALVTSLMEITEELRRAVVALTAG